MPNDLPAALATIAALRADRDEWLSIANEQAELAKAANMAREKAERERDEAEEQRNILLRSDATIRNRALCEVEDVLLRHADSYTARGNGGWYHALRHAADIVKGMVSE
jgi:hypothetical protein